MYQICAYYFLVILGFTNGVFGMMMLLAGDLSGLINLGLAIYIQHRAKNHKESAMMYLAIRRAGIIVRKCQTEFMTEKELTAMFHKELLNEMLRRNIENAEEKAKSLENNHS